MLFFTYKTLLQIAIRKINVNYANIPIARLRQVKKVQTKVGTFVNVCKNYETRGAQLLKVIHTPYVLNGLRGTGWAAAHKSPFNSRAYYAKSCKGHTLRAIRNFM